MTINQTETIEAVTIQSPIPTGNQSQIVTQPEATEEIPVDHEFERLMATDLDELIAADLPYTRKNHNQAQWDLRDQIEREIKAKTEPLSRELAELEAIAEDKEYMKKAEAEFTATIGQ